LAKLFISWSGEEGRELANGLASLFSVFRVLEPWVSHTAIESGRPWFDELDKALDSSVHGLACLSTGASYRPWINFEVGYLFGRLKKCSLVQIGNDPIAPPLGQLQTVRGDDRTRMETILAEMLGDAAEARRVFEHRWEHWSRLYERACHLRPGIADHVAALYEIGMKLAASPVVHNNKCFTAIVEEALRETRARLRHVETEYRAPANLYPDYLIALQRTSNVKVNALAMVDDDEHFWKERQGREILKTSHSDSRRVFVVRNRAQLSNYMDILVQHASQYSVRVMDRDFLCRNFEGFAKDYSLINHDGPEVLADYVTGTGMDAIRFSCSPDELSDHRDMFEKIWRKAVPISDSEDCESIWARITELTKFDAKTVEMSTYISVHDYDEHEIEHAYYPEMMDVMIQRFKDTADTDRRDLRLLEMGAGTGIFTRRLALHFPHAEIVALEIDWACFKRLEYHAKCLSNVHVHHEDSRRYDPVGKFDAIFSSFSDHHIRPTDKGRYFENVARNLKPGGKFIVGDEYLPPHDEDNREQRLLALEAYHNHIIGIAEYQGRRELAALERAALRSGVEERGDFKLTCRRYEDFLHRSGFKFNHEKIGPLPENGHAEPAVGGIYVYVSELTSRSINPPRNSSAPVSGP
jgi:SAM-dependent methyltransferase